VEQMLAARLGPGNVRVQVAAELETKREVVRSQTFDPNGQVVRSTQTVEEHERSIDTETEPPTTVAQNLPQNEVEARTDSSRSSETTREEQTVNYEISSVQRESVVEPGDIRRLSVAVLVNGTWTTADDGSRVYEERSPEELERLANLVRSAVGFNGERGDTVTVEAMQFVDPMLPGEAQSAAQTILDTLSRNIMTLIQWIVLLIVMVLAIVLGLRPLIQRVFPKPEPAGETPIELPAAAAQPVAALAPPAGETGAAPAEAEGPALTPAVGIEETMDQLIELRAVEGRVRASSIRRLGDIVEEYPDEAINILRS
jgi:flagellar M-ring protein FliF